MSLRRPIIDDSNFPPEQRETLLKQLQVNAEDMEVQFVFE